ncbi:uncharacterized protein EAF01_000756 [Botrytis porri]|uniref:Uncharacterized protein n=1 Tax=Botrytis porri TaxID=87229 RepID=A0A4Z1K9T8_9HELO|nr:uncharacterized protein EAF01_000756 [Botrytis porri]KAF7914350.1 hypothetical protein EAF01_000756 [Botrytis porri]TGO82767.1 hypothetical protein BPOR_0763g00030 [Botrytis porri]
MSFSALPIPVKNVKEKTEKPKVAVRKDRWKVLQKAGTHVLPIMITITLLFLNGYNTYANSLGIADAKVNTRLNGLQFVAKVHEILIGISLSTIILSFLQHEALRQGIPLGGFLIAFRITDLGSLVSPELWAAGTFGHHFKRRLLFIVMSLFAMILAAVSGPASAILMLPSLDWWIVPTTKYSSWSTTHFTLNAEKSQVWPKQVDNSSFDTFCASESNKFSDNCAAGGFSAIRAWVDRPSSQESQYSWNITMPMNSKQASYNRFIGGASSFQRDLKMDGFYNTYTWCLSQTVSVPTGSLVTSVAQMVGSQNETSRFQALINGEDPPAPQVVAACMGRDYNITNGSIKGYKTLDDLPLPFLNRDTSQGRYEQSEVRHALQMWDSARGGPSATWMQPKNKTANSPSIGVVMFDRYQGGLGVQNNLTSITNRQSWYLVRISSCSLFAGWQASKLYIDPTRDRYIHSPSTTNPTQSLDNWMRDFTDSTKTMRTVQIDAKWANAALPPNDIILPLASSSFGTNNDNPLGMIATTFISDTMSRIPYMMNIGFKVLIPTVAPNHNFTTLSDVPKEVTDIHIKRFRYGYSYSLQGSTRSLAVFILVLHMLLALIHAVLIYWHGYTNNILESLTEILALAINSPPSSNLDNTCAGIERVNTYKKIIRVREVSSSHLGLIVGDDGDITTEEVMADKKYGCLREE